jgi:DMSO/TMAO reductase YedYZ molybdopterin-dependent catalytic subunit
LLTATAKPAGLDESTSRVGVASLVAHPQCLTMTDLKARERREVDFTLECSGNTGTGLDFFIGGIGNAR